MTSGLSCWAIWIVPMFDDSVRMSRTVISTVSWGWLSLNTWSPDLQAVGHRRSWCRA